MQRINLSNSLSDTGAERIIRFPVRRRNFLSGFIAVDGNNVCPDIETSKTLWQKNQPVYLPGLLLADIDYQQENLLLSKSLYESVLSETDIDEVLSQSVYTERLGNEFELLCSRFDASDDQEIVSVDFDAYDRQELIEDIWMRVSWLSFEEADESLRFRFSFGMEGYEDVSKDLRRQMLAAELEQRIFPESSIISENICLKKQIGQIINSQDFKFLERIVYFNAPNGGAQFHHDAEKGHVGVVYAQLTGRTFWFALSKTQLIDEIIRFISIEENCQQFLASIKKQKLDGDFVKKINNRKFIDQALNDLFHPELALLLNSNKLLFEQLVNANYAYYLQPGDVLLLPQESMKDCAWHSVYCVGDEAGEALSFAIKRFD